jgi:hypothetical protein
LEPDRFFRHYQLLRNISYVEPDGRSLLLLVTPRRNTAVARELEVLDDLLESTVRRYVRLVWLEELVRSIRTTADSDALADHFARFEAKYVI